MLKSIYAICLTLCLVTFAWLGQTLPVAAAPVTSVPVVTVLPGLQGVFTGTRPDHLGVQAGKLSACPTTPNCVVSQDADPDHDIAPIPYTTDHETARTTLLAILKNQPRVNLVEASEDYIYAEFTSRLMGFVDDVEFYFPEPGAATPPDAASEAAKVIQMRAAARLGESDLGVNRRRLEQFRLAMQASGV